MNIKEVLRCRQACVHERELLLSCGTGERSKRVRELSRKIADADRLIYSVTDSRLRLILICKYIKCMTDDEIADELCYSPRHIRRLFRDAMSELERRNNIKQQP